MNRSGLPGNTAQQPPAQIIIFSLFLHPSLCSLQTVFVELTAGTLSRGTGAGLQHHAWALLLLPSCHAGECDVKPPTLLPTQGIEAHAMSIGNKSSQNYQLAKRAEKPTGLHAVLQTHHYLMP